LNSVGGKREALKWLQQFREIEPSKFALIKVSGECVDKSSDKLCHDLTSLYEWDLYPVVMFGWGNRVTKLMDERGIRSEFIDGNRVTTPHTIEVILEVIEDFKDRIVNGVAKEGGMVHDLTKTPIFYGEIKDQNLGLVGDIKQAYIKAIVDAINKKRVPLLVPLCYDSHDHILNVNADTAAKMLFKQLECLKYISLTPTGGIYDGNGKLIETITLKGDYQKLVESGQVTGGMLKKLKEAKALLEGFGPDKSVQVTSPDHLVYELFTTRGKGTKITLGYDMDVHYSMEGLDEKKLKDLIESRLGTLVSGFFTTPGFKPDIVILERDYRGAMLLQRFDGGLYLDKVVVGKKYEGNGLASEMKDALKGVIAKENANGCFLRSRKDRPANETYQRWVAEEEGPLMANGVTTDQTYAYYWLCVKDPSKIQGYLKFASNKPCSFK